MNPPNSSSTPQPSLGEEIRLIRAVMLRVQNLLDEGSSLDELLKLLNSVSLASTRLAKLLQTDVLLSKQEDLTEVLNAALAALLEEMESDR